MDLLAKQGIAEDKESKQPKKHYVSKPKLKDEKSPDKFSEKFSCCESEMKANWLDEQAVSDFRW